MVRAETSALHDLGIYDANYLTILNDLGLAYSQAREFSKAEEILQKCLSIRAELGTTPDEEAFNTMQNLAAVYAAQGRVEQAVNLYKTILTQSRRSSFEDIYTTAREKLLQLYEHEDSLETALRFLDEQKADESATSSWRYESSLFRGRIKRKLKEYDESQEILKALISSFENKPGSIYPVLYIRSLVESGILFVETGSFSQGEIKFLKAYDLASQLQPQNTGLLIEVLNNMAALYERLGIYDKAITFFQRALELNSRRPDQNDLATITLESNIAGIELKQFNISSAIDKYVKVLNSMENSVPKSNPFYITVLNNLATAYRSNNEYDQARKTLEQGYQLIKEHRLENEDLGSIVMNNMAVLLTAISKPEEAIVFYERAYRVKKELYGDNSVLLADIASNMAVVYWALRKPAQAIPLFQKSASLSLRKIKYVFPTLSESEQIQFYRRLKEDFERFASIAVQASSPYPELLIQVFDNQIRIKSLLFFTQQHRRNIILEQNDSILNHRFELLKNKREKLGYLYQLPLEAREQLDISSTKLEQEIDSLEKSISLQTSEASDDHWATSDVGWSDIKNKLLQNEAIIETIRFRKYDLRSYAKERSDRVSFGFTDSIYYAALITTRETTRNPRLVLLKEGTNLETRFLSYYRNSLQFGLPDNNSYDQYWKPFASSIQNKSKVYFSADGVYHRINLNTLRNPDSNEFLIQKFDIQYLINPAQYLDRTSASFTSRKAVLVGNPAFDPPAKETRQPLPAHERFDPLPGTNAEVSELNSVLTKKSWDTHILLKGDASEVNLKKLRSPDILHIATHGFFSSDKVKLNAGTKKDFLFYSGLALSGANANILQAEAEAPSDGILTAYEVMNLNLTNTHLVVLSACETGLGKIENGEGVYGLQRSFLQAGARNIVISLWKVDDTITKSLMVKFYQYLVGSHTEREALKLAQLDQMKLSGNPAEWGAFIIIGID